MRQIFIILTACGLVAAAADAFDINESYEYLLPKTSVPVKYDLDLVTHLGPRFEYNGTVTIDIFVLNETRSLTVHSSQLEIDLKRSFVSGEDGVVAIVGNSTNDKYQFLQLDLSAPIQRGYHKLVVAFSGHYYTITSGLFLDNYKTPSGETRYLLATHFEPARARQMFPCYDEPFYRTPFEVHVTHRKDYRAVSNAPVRKVERYNTNYVTTHFKRSANFSTYLLALAVTDFDTYVYGDAKGRKYRLLTNPANINHTYDGLNISAETIKYLEKVTKVDYPLPKLDSIAVPKFGGGMENWGLIVYGTGVAKDFLNSTARKGTTELITHEISHQWFGDLVTLAWWDYVWLNEGFATYYAALIADKILPQERFMYNFVNKFQTVLRTDAFNTTMSLNAHVEMVPQISVKFDSISYTKGAAVIRFMASILRSFDKGITNYLTKYQQKNSVPTDLLHEFDNYGLPQGTTAERVMDSWLNKPGYPLVTLNVTKVDDVLQLVVSQEKFNDLKSDTKWWIPVHVATEENPVFEIDQPYGWLRDNDESIVLYSQPFDGWVLLNLQQSIYCRVNYDDENWRKIIAYLKTPDFERIHVLNRAQLVDDAMNLAEFGILKQEIALELLEYLEQEKDDLPHKSAGRGLRRYAKLLEGTACYNNFKKFVARIYKGPASDIFGSPDLYTVVKRALELMQKRHVSSAEEFNAIADMIFSHEELDNLTELLLSRFRTTTLPEYYDLFLMRVHERASHNSATRERFLQREYVDVERWLKARV